MPVAMYCVPEAVCGAEIHQNKGQNPQIIPASPVCDHWGEGNEAQEGSGARGRARKSCVLIRAPTEHQGNSNLGTAKISCTTFYIAIRHKTA